MDFSGLLYGHGSLSQGLTKTNPSSMCGGWIPESDRQTRPGSRKNHLCAGKHCFPEVRPEKNQAKKRPAPESGPCDIVCFFYSAIS
jgi:hypothetical protein